MIDHGLTVASEHGIARSPEWSKVQKEKLAQTPFCAACGSEVTNVGLQAHHIFPFHYCIALGRPDLELNLNNLIVLCETEKDKPSENHHLLIGHFGDFKEGNLNVEEDAKKTYFNMKLQEIKESIQWQSDVKTKKLKALELMTDGDKKELRSEMDRKFPL